MNEVSMANTEKGSRNSPSDIEVLASGELPVWPGWVSSLSVSSCVEALGLSARSCTCPPKVSDEQRGHSTCSRGKHLRRRDDIALAHTRDGCAGTDEGRRTLAHLLPSVNV